MNVPPPEHSPAWEAVMALAKESIATDGELRIGLKPKGKVARWAANVSPDAEEAAAVIFALHPDLDDEDRDLVRACLQHGMNDGKRTVNELARWVCLSRRTITKRLGNVGLPTPAAMIAIGSTVRAVRLVIRDGEVGRVGRAARAMGLASSCELSRMVHDALGVRPTQLTDDRPAAIAARFIRHKVEAA